MILYKMSGQLFLQKPDLYKSNYQEIQYNQQARNKISSLGKTEA